MLCEIVKEVSYLLTILFGLSMIAAYIYFGRQKRRYERESREREIRSEAAHAVQQAVAYTSVVLGLRNPNFFKSLFRGRECFHNSLAFGCDRSVTGLASTFGRFDGGVEISLAALRVRNDLSGDEKTYIAVEMRFPGWRGVLPSFALSTLDSGRLDAMSDRATAGEERWQVVSAPGLAARIGPHMLYVHGADGNQGRVLSLLENEEFLNVIVPLWRRGGVVVEAIGERLSRSDTFRVFWRVQTPPSKVAWMAKRHMSENWVLRMYCDTVVIAGGLQKAVMHQGFRLPDAPACNNEEVI